MKKLKESMGIKLIIMGGGGGGGGGGEGGSTLAILTFVING